MQVKNPGVRFALHYAEMVAVMIVGMMLLYPLWALAIGSVAPNSVLRGVEVDTLVMATTMAVPMAAWMRFRGHAWAPTLEMSAVMYAGFLVLFPLHWVGAMDEGAVMELGHVLMFAFMLLAMLFRRHEYSGGHAHHHQRRGGTVSAPLVHEPH